METNQEPGLRSWAKAVIIGDLGCALHNSRESHACTPGPCCKLSVKGQVVNILGFVGQRVSVTTT